LRGALVLRIRWFDPIAEAAELPDHFPSAPLFRLLGDCWAAFFVTDSLVQDQPDWATLSVGNRPDGLLVPETRYCAAMHNLEDGSFGLHGGVGGLIENSPHLGFGGGRGRKRTD
jgi:hypothetical protein